MSNRWLPHAVIAVLLVALCAIVAACVLVVTGDPPAPVAVGREERPAAAPPAVSASPAPTPPPADGPREVLRGWDAARADAWAAADPRALAELYTPGSVAGRRDVAMLRAWSRRGVRVDGLETQVLDLRVVERGPRRLALVVTDRVAAVVVGPTRLTGDQPSTRRVVLVRASAAGWRVAAVSPVG
ncbi:hypothetical protein [Nocardioides litoris]|uniref:hypothetical protein n=1 Tax=Nocardioides litoris TaxID=1926648 RepID=UPI00111DF925|nr:hypothetical protein [Nocardioides litoris]